MKLEQIFNINENVLIFNVSIALFNFLNERSQFNDLFYQEAFHSFTSKRPVSWERGDLLANSAMKIVDLILL